MSNEKMSHVEPFLRCPCPQKSSLLRHGAEIRCGNQSCLHAKQGFKLVGEIPVLISSQRTNTICSEPNSNDGSGYKNRRKLSAISRLKSWLSERDSLTRRNCEAFLGGLKANGAGRVLVIGSGTKGAGTEKLWNSPDLEKVGVDIYPSESVKYIADAHFLPFADQSFDGVFIQAVLEHVIDPVAVVSEIHRVLKSNGLVYAETPFMQQVHEGAYDYTRFTPLGHRLLFKHFESLSFGPKDGPGTVLAWSIRYLVWGLTRSRRLGVLAALPFRMVSRRLDRLVTQRSLWDASSGAFFLGTKIEGFELLPRDVPPLYNGMQR